MILENELKQIHTSLQDYETKLKEKMIEDFQDIYVETGIIYSFFSGMGTYGFQKNGQTLSQGDDLNFLFLFNNSDDEEKYYETADENKFEPINNLLKSYVDTLSYLENEFNHYVDYTISENKIQKQKE